MAAQFLYQTSVLNGQGTVQMIQGLPATRSIQGVALPAPSAPGLYQTYPVPLPEEQVLPEVPTLANVIPSSSSVITITSTRSGPSLTTGLPIASAAYPVNFQPSIPSPLQFASVPSQPRQPSLSSSPAQVSAASVPSSGTSSPYLAVSKHVHGPPEGTGSHFNEGKKRSYGSSIYRGRYGTTV